MRFWLAMMMVYGEIALRRSGNQLFLWNRANLPYETNFWGYICIEMTDLFFMNTMQFNWCYIVPSAVSVGARHFAFGSLWNFDCSAQWANWSNSNEYKYRNKKKEKYKWHEGGGLAVFEHVRFSDQRWSTSLQARTCPIMHLSFAELRTLEEYFWAFYSIERHVTLYV